MAIHIALAKGRIHKVVMKYLAESGYDFPTYSEESRKLIFEDAKGQLKVTLVKSPDVAVYVERGAADVGIVGEMIASVHPRGSREDAHEVRSLAGGYLSPGLMDTHVHLESSHLPPERYAEIVLTQGTTAVFWDPHELANVLGVAGVGTNLK